MKKTQQRQRSRRLQGLEPSSPPTMTTRSPDPPAANEHPTVAQIPPPQTNPSPSSSQVLSVSDTSVPTLDPHSPSTTDTPSLRRNFATNNSTFQPSSSSSTTSSDPPADQFTATSHESQQNNTTPIDSNNNTFNLRKLSASRLRGPINQLTSQINQLMPKRNNNTPTSTASNLVPSQTIPNQQPTQTPVHQAQDNASPCANCEWGP